MDGTQTQMKPKTDYETLGFVPHNAKPVHLDDRLREAVELNTGYRPEQEDRLYVLREEGRGTETYIAIVPNGLEFLAMRAERAGIRQGAIEVFKAVAEILSGYGHGV